ncbi:unannotated protein [freshwater metagenome]|uniref:Unannotated protein n=1 Tax=freshwater metagenome TaxID=449393 RepID=A0A6J7RUZ0_9ZZZZ|nr:YHS domain-containing protein [Actinomycetota bacterium]
MSHALSLLLEGLGHAVMMAWQIWWALVLGFAISAMVQAWAPHERIEALLSGPGVAPIARATGFGAASSSCSYAAIAIAKSLFQKGASSASSLAFQFASTNLVWELGLVIWVLMGWQFTLAEYLGGIVMILLMWAMLRLFVSKKLEEQARQHARGADTGHEHHMAATDIPLREKLTDSQSWSDVAHNFRGDWQMLWKEIVIGLLLAGYIALLGDDFFNGLFLTGAPPLVQTVWGALIGPVIAMLSFVCSVGNIPLAAVLWSGGLSFAGVLAFIFADLIVLPIIVAYRKYYGNAYAARIVALMFVTMVLAALIIDVLFGAVGLIPSVRPTTNDVFGTIKLDYKAVLNAIATVAFIALWTITAKRGATDPVCGMSVDKQVALKSEVDGKTWYFCGPGCQEKFLAE